MRTDKAIKNITLQFATRFVGLILYFLLTPLILKLLGKEYYGLNQLLIQTIGYLNLAELGIGVSLSVLSYKYLVEEDFNSLNKLLSTAQFIYSIIGGGILVFGSVFSFYLDDIYKIGESDSLIVQIAFIIYIFSASCTYFFSVPALLLGSAQKGYKTYIYTVFISPLTYIGYFIFIWLDFSIIGIALTTLLLNCWSLYGSNKVARKEFPWIKLDVKEKDYNIIKTTKFVFLDKLLVLGVFQTDYILISYFLGITYIASYSFYVVFFSYIRDLIFMLLNPLTNGAGEMYEKNELDKIYNLWRDAISFCFFIAIVAVVSLFILFPYFIELWLNKTMVLSSGILICFLMNLFYLLTVHSSTLIIGSKNMYKQRIFGSMFELFVNIVLSVILIPKLGVLGAVLGTTIGHYISNSWYIPKLFFISVNKPFNLYFLIFFRYVLILIFVTFLSMLLYKYGIIPLISSKITWLKFIIMSAIIIPFVIVITYISFIVLDDNFSALKNRLVNIYIQIKSKLWKV
jgi:O-antigen/teichoic acid export membrane protein